jgi:hypothetical protein
MLMKMGQKLMSAVWRVCGSSRLGWALIEMLMKEFAHAFSCMCSVISECTFYDIDESIVRMILSQLTSLRCSLFTLFLLSYEERVLLILFPDKYAYILDYLAVSYLHPL